MIHDQKTLTRVGNNRLADTHFLHVEIQQIAGLIHCRCTDDGIIQNNRFGVKKRGFLQPDYLMPTTGDAITRW